MSQDNLHMMSKKWVEFNKRHYPEHSGEHTLRILSPIDLCFCSDDVIFLDSFQPFAKLSLNYILFSGLDCTVNYRKKGSVKCWGISHNECNEMKRAILFDWSEKLLSDELLCWQLLLSASNCSILFFYTWCSQNLRIATNACVREITSKRVMGDIH